MLKRLISVLLILAVCAALVPCVSFAADTSSGSAAANLVYTFEDDAYFEGLIGDDVIFLSSNSKCYFKHEKHDYADFDCDYYTTDSGVLMIPTTLIAEAFDCTIMVDGNTVTVNDSIKLTVGSDKCSKDTLDAPVELKDGVVYLPVASFAKSVFSKLIYDDGRGFCIIYSAGRENVWVDDGTWYSHPTRIQRYMHFDRPSGEQIYEDMKASGSLGRHPTNNTVSAEAVREKIASDVHFKKLYIDFISQCENEINKKLVVYSKPDGLRLYGALASEAAGLIYRMGLAYSLTGDTKYADRCWKEIENILSWPDWNVENHYLDTGAAVSAILSGYDFIYYTLSQEQIDHFLMRFQELYMDFAVGVYTGTSSFKHNDSRLTQSNWGAVCGNAMLAAGIHMMDEEDENSLLTQKAKFLASCALKTLCYSAREMYPSGASKEGIVYTEYYLSNLCSSSNLLRANCGTDYGLFSAPGFENSPSYFLYTQTKNGIYAYSETDKRDPYYPASVFTHAYLSGNTALAASLDSFREYLGVAESYSHLLYSPMKSEAEATEFPLDRYDAGTEMVTFKSSWSDQNGLYMSALGGKNAMSMAHFDKGSFIYEQNGVRWLDDIGKDNYNITEYGGYWSEAARKRLYRLRTEGHNSVVINPTTENFGQIDGAIAEVERFETSGRGALAVYNLSEVYSDNVSSYKRGIRTLDNRNTGLVQDEITLKSASELYWFAHSQADYLEVGDDGKSVMLTKSGKKLKVDFYCNQPGFELSIMNADPLSSETYVKDEYSRVGWKKIALHIPNAKGNVIITAKLLPVDGYVTYDGVEYEPVSDWSVPEGELSNPSLDTLSVSGTPVEGFNPENYEYLVELPYGAPIPTIEATSSDSDVQINNPKASGDEATVMVTRNDVTRVYVIKFELGTKITDDIVADATKVGLPQGAELIEAASVYANHTPQIEHPAACATDGNFATSWTSDRLGTYIELDLGSAKDISGIALAFLYGNTRTYNFEILVSDNKQDYTRIYNGKSSGLTAEYETIPISAKARYIRLVGYANSESEWNNLAEFAVYSGN